MFTSLFLNIQRYLNHYATVKSRQILLTVNDDALKKAGISRALVLKGVQYWPWREDDQNKNSLVASPLNYDDTEALPATDVSSTSVEAAPVQTPETKPADYPHALSADKAA